MIKALGATSRAFGTKSVVLRRFIFQYNLTIVSEYKAIPPVSNTKIFGTDFNCSVTLEKGFMYSKSKLWYPNFEQDYVMRHINKWIQRLI